MTSRRDALKSAALLGLAAWAPAVRAQAGAVPASAVPGHFTARSVRLWIPPGPSPRATLAWWTRAEGEPEARRMPIEVADGGLVATLDRLAESTAYRYRVEYDGVAGPAGGFRTASGEPRRPRDFRVYLGSCAYTEAHTRGGSPYGDELGIFDRMARQMRDDALPHFMLWLGDNLYLRNASRTGAPAEFSSPELMRARYAEVRAKPILRELLAATHHYATWDDHDYGPNNADKSFVHKEESLRLFRAYWPNPEAGDADVPGVCTRFRQEDVEFFLLDSRYHRDAEKAPPDAAKAMFGPAQMAWLRRSLAQSTATFRVVAGGSQFLSQNENGRTSGWHSYAAERDAFLAWLAAERIPGVILLSGDRHNTQVYRLDRDGAPPVHEFSCSPFTSRLVPVNEADRANPRAVPELAVERRNFGTLEFSGDGDRRRATARCFSAGGELLWTRALASAA